MPVSMTGRLRHRSRGRVRTEVVLDAVAALIAVTTAAVVGLRLLPRDGHRLQIAAEGSRDMGLTVAPVVFGVAAGRRHPRLALTFAALSLGARRRPGPTPRAGTVQPTTAQPTTAEPTTAELSTALRIVSANLLSGNTRIGELGRQLIADDADVIVLQEFTDEHLAGLRRCGLLDAMPHHFLDPRPSFQGSAVLSRLPLQDGAAHEVHGVFMAAASVITPGGSVRVVAVHAVNPAHRAMIGPWRAQLDWLAGYVRESASPAVLAGDFNATLDHRALRDLVASGLVDAHDAVGHGLGLTWPRRSWTTGRWPAVPLMRLDHVLVTPGIAVRSVGTAPSAGSDHRRLVADLGLTLVAVPTAV